MYGPQFVEGVRALANGSGDIAPPVGAACGPDRAGFGSADRMPPAGARGLLLLRAPPVRWSDYATLAGDPALLSALQEATRGDPLLLPVDDPARFPEPSTTPLRRALTQSLASLWRAGAGDEAMLRDVVSGARAANRVGRRLRELGFFV